MIIEARETPSFRAGLITAEGLTVKNRRKNKDDL
jgi:hypothetical protein